ncbi:hypothetical protein [Desulfotomaculum copahuensis]|uniref:Uncharacterized protein n=1 Tax=Desulfotomaculum copahuensis TaxID=1838280 RepID=A0A1B7LGT3_9FIRM|nr:hypothetical protein [Desulfotomaculum copahuensis]OAT85311.1 hypothetical protein A6M21_17345 [Desulfotomaculum copahuensis]
MSGEDKLIQDLPAADLSAAGEDAQASGFFTGATGKLTEFRFNEPYATPSAPAGNLASATFATTFILVDDPGDLVWINATMSWYATFTAAGSVDVIFSIVRDGTPIYSITQSVANPVAAGATVSNIARLQYVDLPLAGVSKPTLTPVTYSLYVTTATAVAFSTGPFTLSVAEIEPNRPGIF